MGGEHLGHIERLSGLRRGGYSIPGLKQPWAGIGERLQRSERAKAKCKGSRSETRTRQARDPGLELANASAFRTCRGQMGDLSKDAVHRSTLRANKIRVMCICRHGRWRSRFSQARDRWTWRGAGDRIFLPRFQRDSPGRFVRSMIQPQQGVTELLVAWSEGDKAAL